tara:strand:+ start:513 stop:881 length:369 start_codon:yes stop_codon:yes gene_type:complete
MPKFAKSTGYQMKGSKFYGKGNQSPLKQEGPINKQNPKLQKSENPDTWIYPGEGFSPGGTKDQKFTALERLNDLEERISFIDEDVSASGKPKTKQQEKDQKFLRREADIMRKRIQNTAKKKK